jgi:hypothetical protein
MTTSQKIDSLISELESAVEESLAYFAGQGAATEEKIDIWTPREVLCHVIFWHQATAEGMESVASGGEPYRVRASTDEMNARAVGRASGKSVDTLVQEARAVQARLVAAARKVSDPEAVVLVRGDGSSMSTIERLELIPRHWKAHIEEFKALS